MKSTINSPVTRRSFIKKSTILTGASLLSYPGFGNSFSVKNNSLPFLSAAEAANEIRMKNISSFELTQMILERIKKYNPKINAIILLIEEQALERAREADAALAKGENWGVFHGVPITIKDSFQIEGVATTAGAPFLKDYIPDNDATAVARLKKSGAVILGHTNVPFMLSDHQSFNEIYGRTNNPWNLDRTPGGSTGGGAAAVTAGLSYLSIGSDIGGSIRVPAHFCGIFGHKPTVDLIPQRGHIPPVPGTPPSPSSELPVAGPLARSAEDLRLALSVCGGPDTPENIAYSWKLPEPRKKELKQYKIKYVINHPDCPVSSEISPLMEQAIQEFKNHGLQIDEGWPEDVNPAEQYLNYLYLLMGAMSMGLPNEEIERMKAIPSSQRTPSQSLQIQAISDSHIQYNKMESNRLRARMIWQKFFREYDAFILPTAFVPAFPHTTKPWEERLLDTPEGQRPFNDMLFWISFATHTGLPASVFPIGVSKTGLPVGLQVIGPFLEDATPIDIAGKFNEILGGIQHPQGY
jgi:amidase